jgi:uncharacterized protein (TIGR03086 family)
VTDFATVDIRPQYFRVLDRATEIINGVTADQLDLPTPCADWNLDRLLAHIVGQNHGFADAAEGARELAVFADRPVGDDPAGANARSVERLRSAYSGADVMDRLVHLPEITTARDFPAGLAISFQYIDSIVHGWDVGRTIGAEVIFDDDLLEIGWEVAQAVPGGEGRIRPGSMFAPELADDHHALLDRILAWLGRSPDWTPPRSDR